MNLIFRLAWRNIFRNSHRTFLTCLLLSSSLVALIITDGLMIGMMRLMIETSTRTFAGDGQVHRRHFLDAYDVDLYLDDSSKIEATLAASDKVEAFSLRTMTGGMISSADNMAGGVIWGVEARSEARVSKLKEALRQGDYLSGSPGEILIGEDMAQLLEVTLGDRLVLTLSQVEGGELSQVLFRLSGIFKFGLRELDNSMVFINLNQSRKILGLNRGGLSQGSHEVAFNFANPGDANNKNLALIKTLNTETQIAETWVQLQPQMSAMLGMMDYSLIIVGSILFFIAALGIINSMFMSIYERIYEFGVAKAIGTRPGQLVMLILTEALCLASLSVIIGMLVAYLVNSYFSVHGIPMGEFEFEGISFSDNIQTVLTLNQFTTFPLIVVLLTLVAAIYPAIFAARIQPSQALNKSL